MHPIYYQIVLEAEKYLGHIETSYNSSPLIDKWLGRVSKSPGNSWCIAYAWCMVDDAFSALNLSNPVPRVAGVHYLIQKAKKAGLWSKNPGIGYIFCIDHGKDKRGNKIGHGGIIKSIQGDYFNSLEGNSNSEGSREGNCVAAKYRAIAEATLGFVDPGIFLPA
jgi:hypothetical protein